MPENLVEWKRHRTFVASKRTGATKIDAPQTFQEDLVCVVDNGMFDAAAYLYNEAEMEYFKKHTGNKVFLIVPNAKELAK